MCCRPSIADSTARRSSGCRIAIRPMTISGTIAAHGARRVTNCGLPADGLRVLLFQQCLQDHACGLRLLDAHSRRRRRQRALAARRQRGRRRQSAPRSAGAWRRSRAADLRSAMPPAEHLARHRCADLFLDTLPYNAHTTASDALWAGLPLLTCRGEDICGPCRRQPASHNWSTGADCDETAAISSGMAIELAQQPEQLFAIRGKLSHNRSDTPLFDTARSTRDIEAAFQP